MRPAGFVWLALVAIAALHLGLRLRAGVELGTDLLALLPQEDRDAGVQRAKQHITESIGQRIILLVGHADRATARAAGAELAEAIEKSGLATSVAFHLPADDVRRVGSLFFPYRAGLLSPADRALLEAGEGRTIVDRTLAAVYAPVPMVDAALLRADPFLLYPTWLAALPRPLPRLALDDGVLSVRDGGKTYVLVSAQLAGNVYSLAFQDRFMAAFGPAEQRLHDRFPDATVLRVGALFYAHDGARTSTRETSAIGLVSLIGTIVLVLAVFRALRPLWLSMLAIAVGILCAFSVSFWLFGTLHVAALLFGTSLIGIATDYCLQYLTARFATDLRTPQERLRRVLPGISLGIATTLIGYVTLMFAPFPGLRQVALFSAVGLVASFVTVLLWLPALDGDEPFRHGGRLLAAASWLWRFWEAPAYRRARAGLLALCALLFAIGAARFTVDDDVHHLQALAPGLRSQEDEVRRLTGMGIGTEFLLVRGASAELVLQREELVAARLDAARRKGALTGFQSLAQIVPSIERQRENQALVRQTLIGPYLASIDERLGLSSSPVAAAGDPGFLTPSVIPADSPLGFVRSLAVDDGTGDAAELMLLDGVADREAVAAAVAAIPGVQFIDPTGDVTRLLRAYRRRAVILLAVSAVLMVPVLLWRYGPKASLRVLVPPAAAVLLTPPLTALGGVSFTFFNAMALVLVLSIGFDYAVFCRETMPAQRPVTMLGVWLAMATTLLAFGLLAFSHVAAVQAFGLTLLIGTSLAFLFAPLAGDSHAA